MKRTYKPISLVYLLVTAALIFQGTINAIVVEKGPEAETGIEIKTTEEADEAAKLRAQQNIAAFSQLPLSGDSEQEQVELEKTPEEEKVSVSLKDLAARYAQQFQEKGITVARSAQAKVIELVQNFKNRITQIYNILRNLRETLANLPAEKRAKLQQELAGTENAINELEAFSNKALSSGLAENLEDLNEGFKLLKEQYGEGALRKLAIFVLDQASTISEGEQGEEFTKLKELATGLPEDLTQIEESLAGFK